jgi:hypothetical protein
MRMTRDELDEVITRIAELDRDELVHQFRHYPAPFPIDFSDEFLNRQSVDKLRHVFAGLVMHCRVLPDLPVAA